MLMVSAICEPLRIRWVDLERHGAELLAEGAERAINSAAEVKRANRISDRRRRNAFLASRVALRMILRRVAAVDCYGREFSQSAGGKPYLRGHWVQFSLSRSGGLAAIAVCDRPVGIDIEQDRILSAATRDALHRAIGDGCSAAEAGRLTVAAGAPTDMHAWTRLEAFVKLGDGRLAERFAKWAHDPSDFFRQPPGGERGWRNAGTDAEGVSAITVPVPSGYTCTCCIAGATGVVDAAGFLPPAPAGQ